MSLFSKPIKSLDDLYEHTLQDVYHAEHQITKALPKMASKANDPQLRQAFETHCQETESQIRRLEQVFQLRNQEAKGVRCVAIEGIIAEANEVIGDTGDAQVCDAAMLAAAQAVEHYEIARYGTLIAYAEELGQTEAARILRQTLEEEKATDRKLTQLAEVRLNKKAA